MTKVLGGLAAIILLLVLVLPALATDKVVICHAAGLDGTTKYVTLEIAYPAVYGPAGHFYENGTPRAGHEQDYLGPCQTPSSSPSVPPTGTPGPTITPVPSPSVVPSPTPTYTSSPSPKASSTPTATPPTPTLSPSPTVVPTPPFTPLPTPPATDTEPTSSTGSGFPWLLAVLAGIVGGTVYALMKNTAKR